MMRLWADNSKTMTAASPLQQSWKHGRELVSVRERQVSTTAEDMAVPLVTILSIPTSLVPQIKRQGGFPELPSVSF